MNSIYFWMMDVEKRKALALLHASQSQLLEHAEIESKIIHFANGGAK